jgi:hypothetical protein
MRAQEQASFADAIGIGIVFAATGLYFMLAALDVLPSPGEAHGPPAILFAAGLAFFLAGCAAILHAKVGARDRGGELPADAPPWTHLVSRILAIAVAGSLAAIGTWIAIGSGPRAFSFSGPFVEMRTTGETIGRTMFGLGAVIVWIYAIALTVSTVRRFFGACPVIPAEPRSGESRNP